MRQTLARLYISIFTIVMLLLLTISAIKPINSKLQKEATVQSFGSILSAPAHSPPPSSATLKSGTAMNVIDTPVQGLGMEQYEYMKDWGAESVAITWARYDTQFPYSKHLNPLSPTYFDDAVKKTEQLGLKIVIRYGQKHWNIGYINPELGFVNDWDDWYRNKDQWLNDLKFIAKRYTGYNHVYLNPFYEIYNVPTPQEWQKDIQDAINAVHSVNPNMKFVVCPLIRIKSGYYYGSMGSALDYPLSCPTEIVYAPHWYVVRFSKNNVDGANYNEVKNYLFNNLRWKEAVNKGMKICLGEFGLASSSNMLALKNTVKACDEIGIEHHFWMWHTGDTRLLSDWNGNPTAIYGVYVQEVLRND